MEDFNNIASDIVEPFDEAYYRTMNLNVDFAEETGLQHYCRIGWKEGRNPSANFSTDAYLEMNGDVADAKVNPFWHYIVSGKNEGRAAQICGGAAAQIIFKGETLSEKKRNWRGEPVKRPHITAERLFSTLAYEVARTRVTGLLLSISHDDYTSIAGGVQLCMLREQSVAELNATAVLHIRPAHAIPSLAEKVNDDSLELGVTLNGSLVGYCSGDQLVIAMARIKSLFVRAEVVIHHLMGHSPELITSIITSMGAKNCSFWLHDFFSLCVSYALQRNDVAFCGAPDIKSSACQLCLYSEERNEHLQRLRTLFNAIPVRIISPSHFALEFWHARTTLPYKETLVFPHASLGWSDREVFPIVKDDQKMRIAFVGTPAYHKGWHEYLDIVADLAGNGEIQFYVLSNSAPKSALYTNINVSVTAKNPLSMLEAIRENDIDFVVHWPTWAETFSYSTYESIGAGAQVLTNEISGNVAIIVRETNIGRVFGDMKELLSFLTSDEGKSSAAMNRARRAGVEVEYNFDSMNYLPSV